MIQIVVLLQILYEGLHVIFLFFCLKNVKRPSKSSYWSVALCSSRTNSTHPVGFTGLIEDPEYYYLVRINSCLAFLPV